MKARAQKKFIILAIIFVIGSLSTVAINKLAGDNDYLRQLIIVAPGTLCGYVISSKENDPLLPEGLKAWVGFIIAVFFITTLFWALETYAFN